MRTTCSQYVRCTLRATMSSPEKCSVQGREAEKHEVSIPAFGGAAWQLEVTKSISVPPLTTSLAFSRPVIMPVNEEI